MESKYALRALYWILLIVVPATLGSYLYEASLFSFSTIYTVMCRVIGMALVFYGIALNVMAGRALRKYGHSHPSKRFTQPDRLVKTGIYSCMRHPGQFGLILVSVGTSLIVAGILGILISGWIITAGLLFIIYVEEPEARSIFGEDYHLYEEKVPPISLNILCVIRQLFN
ncbi:MAG: DUF1295 domain-containing protein [Desulfurococcales archaeon]|nr:DUF1295 domain-containing protein [Desulfurococcales archaeon]